MFVGFVDEGFVGFFVEYVVGFGGFGIDVVVVGGGLGEGGVEFFVGFFEEVVV